MNFTRLALAALFFAILAHPSNLWAKKHRKPTPTATPTDTPTQTPTATATTIAYTGPKLYTFDAIWGSKGANADQLNDPEGIDISPGGKIVIADTGNSRIVVWDLNGKPVTTLGAFGSRADWRNPPEFNHPAGVFVHPASKKLYVADTLNQRIVVLDEHGHGPDLLGRPGLRTTAISTSPGPSPRTTSEMSGYWIRAIRGWKFSANWANSIPFGEPSAIPPPPPRPRS